MPIFRVDDVLNYGGFFAGDTVTLIARAVDDTSDERTLTIDQSALTNVGGDRYKIVGGMALDLQFEGERVGAATVVAAKQRETLRSNVATKDMALTEPRLYSYYCPHCDLWILGEPKEDRCTIEGHSLK